MIGMTKYRPPVFFLKKFVILLIKDIKDMSKIHSHISSIFTSLHCGRPFYGVSFGYWVCDEIDF